MEESDHEIRRTVLAGDKDAYGALVVRYSQTVFRVAFRITGNEEDAEEVVQETFLRGYQKLGDFEGRSSFGTWFYRIASNCALDLVEQEEDRCEEPGIAEESRSPSKGEVQVADDQSRPGQAAAEPRD